MTTNYAGLIDELKASGHRYGLLTMQATSTTRRLVNALPGKMTALFSAEHGFFGTAAAGEKTASSWHPFWNVPIHSLYGDHRKPNDEMMDGVEHMIVDMCDIGVRCYTYLATLKNVMEACAERDIPVSVLDRPIPRGGMLDGPMLTGELMVQCRQYLDIVKASLESRGIGDLYRFSLDPRGDNPFGINFHPTQKEAAEDARKLSAWIRSKFGWK